MASIGKRGAVLGILFLALLGTGVSEAQEGGDEDAGSSGNADFGEVVRGVDSDLAEVLEKLSVQRQEIAKERPELARTTNEIAAELRQKRRLSELARQEKDALIHELQALSERVGTWRDERAYVESLLADFRKQFEAEMGLGEVESIRGLLLAADSDGDEGFGNLLDVAELSASRLPDLRGPRVISGEALDSQGIAREGRFVEAGPVNWFVADRGNAAGLIAENRDLRPEIVPGVADEESIRNLADGKGGAPRFDPTLGAAVALGEAEGTILDHIKKGGFWIYPILLLAIIATAAAVGKWFQLVRIRDLRPAVVKDIVNAVNRGELEAAREGLSGLRHPAVAVLEQGIEMEGKPRDDVEEALYEKYLEAQPGLQRGLPLIAIASATAPLLGLLGTVTGMIHTFKLINLFGTGDARSLSSGISEALVTTEFGLVVAIPALILHALLSRRIQGIRSAMEMTSLAFVNGLKERTAGE